jgi:hypothetical protein
MNAMKICSGCQKPLEANGPDGLCPECLLKAGLGTGVDLGLDTEGGSGRTTFVAPTPEEVARLSPQLEILGFIGRGGTSLVCRKGQVPGGFIGEEAGPIGFSPAKRTFPLRNAASICPNR